MIIDQNLPADLQYKPSKIELDDAIAKAKAALLNDIKRSVYIYRCDLGGCNGCEIEIFATITPVFDAERFGIKNTPSPLYADILVYTGAVTRSMRMPGLRAYKAAPDPKLVVSYGACGCTGGIFHDLYCTWGGTDQIIPVDIYIPGCPPTPAQTIFGFAMALGKLGQKLKHKDESQGHGAVAPLPFADIPYKVRTKIEREARLYSGYVYGHDLAGEFLTAMESGNDVFGSIDGLIAGTADHRKADVYAHLREELSGMLWQPGTEDAGIQEGMALPIANQDAAYGRIADAQVPEDSDELASKYAKDHAAELAEAPAEE